MLLRDKAALRATATPKALCWQASAGKGGNGGAIALAAKTAPKRLKRIEGSALDLATSGVACRFRSGDFRRAIACFARER